MHADKLIVIDIAFVPLLVLLGAFVLWRGAFSRQLEALYKTLQRDVNAAVAVLGQRIARPNVPPAVPKSEEHFRAASNALRALAQSASLGLEDSPEADAIRHKALAVLGTLTTCDAASFFTVILARADYTTLEWLANQLEEAAVRLENDVQQSTGP